MMATILPYYTDQGPQGHGQYDREGVHCGLSTASEVSLKFLLPNYTNFEYVFFFSHYVVTELFLFGYSQTAKLHAAHFRRVVNPYDKCITSVRRRVVKTRNTSGIWLDHLYGPNTPLSVLN